HGLALGRSLLGSPSLRCLFSRRHGHHLSGRALTRGSSNFVGHSVREGVQPHALRVQELCTWALNLEPTENLALLRSGICTGSRVRGSMPVRALRSAGENVPKPGSVTLSPAETADCTELMNAFSALSASVLLRFASAAIASTSSPLFT